VTASAVASTRDERPAAVALDAVDVAEGKHIATVAAIDRTVAAVQAKVLRRPGQ
jgi:hypothetical protein